MRAAEFTIFSMQKAELRLVSMAPLGGPVVPDVYTSVITSSPRASAMRSATAVGNCDRCWRPSSSKRSQNMRRSSSTPTMPRGSTKMIVRRSGSRERSIDATLSNCSWSSAKCTHAPQSPSRYSTSAAGLVG